MMLGLRDLEPASKAQNSDSRQQLLGLPTFRNTAPTS